MPASPSALAGYEEEKLDRYFFRPISQPVALLAARLGLTPNAVSVIGLVFGVAGAYFFQFTEARLVAWGVALFFIRNILDYADGQLARLTGKGTKYGYFFDGLCDYGAFASVYAFAVIGIWPAYGLGALALAAAAAASGALQGPMLDFYKHEYRFWALGSDKDRYRLPEELRTEAPSARGFDRILLRIAVNYSGLQMRFTRVRRSQQDAWMTHRPQAAFRERYSRLNRWPLKGWFLVGPNWQAYLLFGFGLVGRMDLFFWTQIVGLNVVLVLTALYQRSCDRRLGAEFGGTQSG